MSRNIEKTKTSKEKCSSASKHSVADHVSSALDNYSTAVVGSKARHHFNQSAEDASYAAMNAKKGVKAAAGNAKESLKGKAEDVKSRVTSAAVNARNSIAAVANRVTNTIAATASNMVDAVTQTATDARDSLANTCVAPLAVIVQANDSFEEAATNTKDAAAEVASDAKDSIFDVASGTKKAAKSAKDTVASNAASQKAADAKAASKPNIPAPHRYFKTIPKMSKKGKGKIPISLKLQARPTLQQSGVRVRTKHKPNKKGGNRPRRPPQMHTNNAQYGGYKATHIKGNHPG